MPASLLKKTTSMNKVWKVTVGRTKRPTSAKLLNLLFLSVLICKACHGDDISLDMRHLGLFLIRVCHN